MCKRYTVAHVVRAQWTLKKASTPPSRPATDTAAVSRGRHYTGPDVRPTSRPKPM